MIRMLVLIAGVALSSAGVAAQPADSTPALKPVATLDCIGSRLQDGPRGTKLACTLDASTSPDKKKFEGEMYGESLYLLAPREINVSWKVMAPTQTLAPAHLEGDYDRVSKHVLQYPRDNRKFLIGGQDDLIGRELVSPEIDGFRGVHFLKAACVSLIRPTDLDGRQKILVPILYAKDQRPNLARTFHQAYGRRLATRSDGSATRQAHSI